MFLLIKNSTLPEFFFKNPSITLTSVDFPPPFLPKMATFSPFIISKLISERMISLLYLKFKFLTLISFSWELFIYILSVIIVSVISVSEVFSQDNLQIDLSFQIHFPCQR